MSDSTIDFLKPDSTPTIGWLVLALGVGAVAAVMHFDRKWALERAEHEAAMSARLQAEEQRKRELARPAPVTPESRRFQRVVPQLRQPWLPVFRAIEGVTQPPVFLLAISIDPASGTVRLEGEAPTFAKALEYATALDHEGLLGPAELRSHEQSLDPAGRATVRFAIVTRWTVR